MGNFITHNVSDDDKSQSKAIFGLFGTFFATYWNHCQLKIEEHVGIEINQRKQAPEEEEYCHSMVTKISQMENLINNPGLQHIAENIFLNLNFETLEVCKDINGASKRILKNPNFWLKKFILRGMPKKHQMDWEKTIKFTKGTNMELFVLLYLKRCSKNERVIDPPCYMDKDFFKKSSKTIQKIMELKTINPNVLTAQLHLSAETGKLEKVKCLAPLTDNPNSLGKYGETPIHSAVYKDYTEIVRILAPLAKTPNVPNKFGKTPIHLAAQREFVETVRILAPLTDKVQIKMDIAEITWRHRSRRTEILRILAPYMNPNLI